jgi:hypothetical protein
MCHTSIVGKARESIPLSPSPEETETMAMLDIRISKANSTIQIDSDWFNPEVQARIFEEGLSKMLNAATAKLTKELVPDDNDRADQALALVEKKLEGLREGRLTAKRATGAKVPAAVMAEARRLAKNIIKASIKAAGRKISDFATKQVTEKANLYISEHPELLEQAAAAVTAAQMVTAGVEVDVTDLTPDAKLVAKREEKNAAKRKETEARQAAKDPKPATVEKPRAAKGKASKKPVHTPAEAHAPQA